MVPRPAAGGEYHNPNGAKNRNGQNLEKIFIFLLARVKNKLGLQAIANSYYLQIAMKIP